MRYQERIYIQNQNSAVKNKDISNVNMSSDFCVFSSPKFDISGATQITCNLSEITFSANTYSDLLTQANINCIVFNDLSDNCFGTADWSIQILTDETVAYSGDFFTTTGLTGTTPTDDIFLNNVAVGFSALSYNFSQSGSTFYLTKPLGVGEIDVNICININISNDCDVTNESCGCPVGYSPNIGNDGCTKIVITGATFSGSGPTILAGNTFGTYGELGAYFYENIQNNFALPVYRPISGTYDLIDQTGATVSVSAISDTTSFWTSLSVGCMSGCTGGRLNDVGISGTTDTSTSDAVLTAPGFTKCLDLTESGIYYIGMAADNECTFSVNGEVYVTLTGGSGNQAGNFYIWHVFPFFLTSGKNIIEMRGNNLGAQSAFGAEVYFPVDFQTLTGATTTGQTGLLFSTAEKVGGTFDLGTTFGYSCPIGDPMYSLDMCGSAVTCTQISKTNYLSCEYTGTCETDCTNVLNQTLSGVTSGGNGIFIISTATTIPLSFNFTGNTDSFSVNSTSFKYEVYKYNNSLNIFSIPPVYSSDIIPYSSFSATNISYQNLPISSLNLDGEYLVKGYFEFDACTFYLNKLGKVIDTSDYKNGVLYQLYNPDIDYYFLSINEASVPVFSNSTSSLNYANAPLFQQIVFPISGTTLIALTSQVVGDFLVILDGEVLTNGIDFTYSAETNSITLTNPTQTNDVISVVYNKTSDLNVSVDVIFVTPSIPSGSTGTQGMSRYFFNTTTGKYEIYTNNIPLGGSEVILMINGITLVSGLDFYPSTSDSKRLILSGNLLINDIVTILYYPQASVINGIYNAQSTIAWRITGTPQTNDGYFVLEVSTGQAFDMLVYSSTTNYVAGVTYYSTQMMVSGMVNDMFYYRVKNVKLFKTICGDNIISINYSEVVPITILINTVNTY